MCVVFDFYLGASYSSFVRGNSLGICMHIFYFYIGKIRKKILQDSNSDNLDSREQDQSEVKDLKG